MEEEKTRNYNKEYENDKKRDKRYTVRVPLYKAKILDEKLKKENEILRNRIGLMSPMQDFDK